MKHFLLTAMTAMIVALITTVCVWWWLQQRGSVANMNDDADVTVSEEIEMKGSTADTHSDIIERETVTAAQTSTPETRTDIPLRDLPLTDTQRSLVETAGIDVDTFIITESMIVCAETKLGAERFGAIIGGESPSFFEGVTLLGCIE